MASVIVKWKKTETTRTLSRVVHPAKPKIRASVREVTRNPTVTQTEFLMMRCGHPSLIEPYIIPTMNNGGGSIMVWECISVAERLVRN